MRSTTDSRWRPHIGDVVAISVGVVVFFMYTWNYLLPSFLKSLGASNELVGLSFSLNFFAYTVFQVIGGAFSDRVGRKPLIVYPGYVTAALYLLIALLRNVHAVVVLSAVAASMSAFQWPAMLALISDSTERPGRYFARMESFVSLGIGIGPFVGALLLPFVGVRGLLALYGVVNFAVTIVREIWITDIRQPKTDGGRLVVNPFRDRKHVIVGLAAILTMVAFNFSIYGPFIQLMEKDLLGYTDAQINMSFFYGNIIGAVLGFYVAETIEGDQFRLSWAMGLFLLEAILLVWSKNPHIYLLVLALPFSQVVHIAYNIGLSKLGDESTKGYTFGSINTISGLISAPMPSLGTGLWSRYGPSAPFAAALLTAVVNAVVIGQRDQVSVG